jgi:hypothetical protein
MSTHPLEQMFAGDDWEINATLLDENGKPYDLTGSPVIKWTLLDGQGTRMIADAEITVVVTDALNGLCTITVAGSVTTRLTEDMYTDVLRLIISNVTSTLCSGQIMVFSDPFKTVGASVATAESDQDQLVRPIVKKFKRIVP